MPRVLILLTVVVVLLCATVLFLYMWRWLEPKVEARQWPDGYAADFTFRDSSDPTKNCDGHMYVNTLAEPRGIRRESLCRDQNRIYIWSRGLSVVLNPDTKVYWKPHMEARLIAGQDSSKNFIRRESLNGRVVDHYEQSLPEADGTMVTTQVWEDVRLHSSLRFVKPSGTFEMNNIREGVQPRSLFEVPNGFREIQPPKEP